MRREESDRRRGCATTKGVRRCGSPGVPPPRKGQGDISRMAALLDCGIALLSRALAPCPERSLPLSRAQSRSVSTLSSAPQSKPLERRYELVIMVDHGVGAQLARRPVGESEADRDE